MAINVYSGLMGSGKSYECVSSVIVPAVAAGRRVVTNIDGIHPEEVVSYCVNKLGIPLSKCGSVVSVGPEEPGQPDFFYFGKDDVQTVVVPGDLVCIDEAWKYWGTDAKLHPNHVEFFRMHRHFTNPATGVSCDLALMVQDISDLHRRLKSVVELSFRCKKLKSFGLAKAYCIQMWEGPRQTLKTVIKTENKKYNPEIFPLYSSYSVADGASGKEVTVDKRQNVLRSPVVWVLVGGTLLAGFVSVSFLVHSFSPKKKPVASVGSASSGSDVAKPGVAVASSAAASSPVSSFSKNWRLVGFVRTGVRNVVVLADSAGRLRYEDPSRFSLYGGEPYSGVVDGERVTPFSGSLPSASGDAPAASGSLLGLPAPPLLGK
jgi:zona occludens toxin